MQVTPRGFTDGHGSITMLAVLAALVTALTGCAGPVDWGELPADTLVAYRIGGGIVANETTLVIREDGRGRLTRGLSGGEDRLPRRLRPTTRDFRVPKQLVDRLRRALDYADLGSLESGPPGEAYSHFYYGGQTYSPGGPEGPSRLRPAQELLEAIAERAPGPFRVPERVGALPAPDAAVPLGDEEGIGRAQRAFSAVFASEDARRAPFRPAIEGRTFYVEGLEVTWSDEVAKAVARTLGERTAYLVLLDGGPKADEPREYWRVDLGSDFYGQIDDRQLTRRRTEVVEQALVSTSGRWGVLTSRADFAVVGGPTPFVRAFARARSEGLGNETLRGGVRRSAATDVIDVVRTEEGTVPDFLPPLLAHLFGREKAEKLLNAR